MPAERIAMRQVREVLRLTAAGVAINEIARRVRVASSTVRLTLKRLAAAGLSWPLPAEMTDAALEAQLFTAVGKKQGHRRHVEPDWADIHRELKRKHVTLSMLWDEYIERHSEAAYPVVPGTSTYSGCLVSEVCIWPPARTLPEPSARMPPAVFLRLGAHLSVSAVATTRRLIRSRVPYLDHPGTTG
jgi:hypothetical protein